MRAWWLAAIALFALDAQPQELRPGLQILVYGATGSIGSLIVDEALARGHYVTAVSRDPSQITKRHPNLTAVAGDLLDPDSVLSLVAGKDVVITSVRGVAVPTRDRFGPGRIRSPAGRCRQALSTSGSDHRQPLPSDFDDYRHRGFDLPQAGGDDADQPGR